LSVPVPKLITVRVAVELEPMFVSGKVTGIGSAAIFTVVGFPLIGMIRFWQLSVTVTVAVACEMRTASALRTNCAQAVPQCDQEGWYANTQARRIGICAIAPERSPVMWMENPPVGVMNSRMSEPLLYRSSRAWNSQGAVKCFGMALAIASSMARRNAGSATPSAAILWRSKND